MHKTDVPTVIYRIMAVFYALKLWSNKEVASFYERGLQFFHSMYFISFITSTVVRACTADEKGDSIILVVGVIIAFVHIFRLWYAITKQKEILTLIDQLGVHSTNDREKSHQVNNKLNNWMNFARYFLLICTSTVTFSTIFPLFSNSMLLYDTGFPADGSRTTFWILHMFTSVGSYYGVLLFSFSPIIWYLLISGAIKYEMLGNQLRDMGVVNSRNRKVSNKIQQNLFLKSLIEAIQTHQRVKA